MIYRKALFQNLSLLPLLLSLLIAQLVAAEDVLPLSVFLLVCLYLQLMCTCLCITDNTHLPCNVVLVCLKSVGY